jgi:hypothetical protein
MTTRDRLMLLGMLALALLVGGWFMVVAPAREHASKVTAEVESARQQLAAAESQAAGAEGARARYSTAYASLVSLGQAVPASTETPALIYALDKATHSRDVRFTSIASGSSGSGGSSGSRGSSSPSATAASSGFAQQAFTFVFDGSFVDLYKLLDQLEGLTAQTTSGSLRVDGRLLTIDSVNLAPVSGEGQSSSGAGGSSKSSSGELTGTITATAYVLPTGQSTLGGATVSGPAGGRTASGGATTASGSGSGGPATAAVVKANP